MKKIIYSLFTVSIVAPFSSAVVSCYIGENTMDSYLSSLSDYDWSSRNGDGVKFDNSSNTHVLTTTDDRNGTLVLPKMSKKYLDFQKFNTGYLWNEAVSKQAVTGAPLNSSFMPAGNTESEFGITSKSHMFNNINELLNWDPKKDMDAKYNKSTVDLQKRVYVAASQVKNQKEGIKWQVLKNSTNHTGPLSNNTVGTKTPYEKDSTAYSYIDQYISWGGSWEEGILVSPTPDVIDVMHKNGIRIYGTVFLDGYHGLTKELLKNFTKKDLAGNYLLVDKLIQIASYYGFDGWYINNEANGSLPNGSIMMYQEILEMMKQFKKKVNASKEDKIKILKLQPYRNDSTLAFNNKSNKYVDNEVSDYAKYGVDEVNLNFNRPYSGTTDFFHRHTPNESEHFMKEYPKFGGENIYNLIDYQWMNGSYGSYDFRDMVYKNMYLNNAATIVNRNAERKYDQSVYNSVATYEAEGTSQFDMKPSDFNNKYKNISNVRNYIFKSQEQNLMSNIQVTGLNQQISDSDVGLSLNNWVPSSSSINGGEDRYYSHQDKEVYLKNDPRINVNGFTRDNTNSYLYDYNKKFRIIAKNNKMGTNSASAGIGNVVKEKTVIFDYDKNEPAMKTNFSLGNGIKFVSNDNFVYGSNSSINIDGHETSNLSPAEKDKVYYSWDNRRLADVSPTYIWDIKDANGDIPPINNISGFYDYDDVYRKGNSIAIGSSFNQYGQINKANFSNGNYTWNVMGTNLVSNNHKVSFTIKSSDKNVVDDFALSVTSTSNLNNSQNNYVKIIKPSTPKKIIVDNQEWDKYTFDLSGVSASETNRISKLGLNFNAKDGEAKINIGEFSIDEDKLAKKIDTEENTISNMSVEYLINRGKNHSIRFNWDDKNIGDVDYYEFYWFDGSKYYRVGQNSSNVYYLPDLQESTKNLIKLKMRPVFKDGEIGKDYNFDVKI